MKKTRLYSVVMIFFSLFLATCSGEKNEGIVVSLPPQAYIADRLTRNTEIPVTVMIPPGAAPSTYSPLPSQIHALHASKIYYAVGHPAFLFEKKHVLPCLKSSSGTFVSMADSISLIPGDPHLWLSPEIVLLSAEKLKNAIIDQFPGQRQIIEINFYDLQRDIRECQKYISKKLSLVEGETFLSYHPAWAYFAHEFGLKQRSVEKDGKSASAKQISGIISQAISEQIPIITVQKEFSSRQTNVIAEATGAKIVVLDPLSRDWLNNLKQTADIFGEYLNAK